MHLILPFAAPLSEGGRHALGTLQLPQLARLLRGWVEIERDSGDEWALSPPHERVLAKALGWQGASGLLPFAARAAQDDGVDTGDLAWGQLTPAHWHLTTDQVTLLDPAALMLDIAGSRTLFDAVQPLFTSEGFAMHWGAPLRWYVAHESLATLRTASLDRVVGRSVDAWLGEGDGLRRVRRLQNEVQMLLYTHPENDRREAQRLLTVNSFWLSGCGVAQPVTAAEPRIDDRLRSAVLAEDWAAWVKAWDTLEAGPLTELLDTAEAGEPHRLTLCGERSAVTLAPAARGLRQRWRELWHRPEPHALLESL